MHYLQVINLKVLSILGKDAYVNLGLLKRLKVNAVNISLTNPQLCEALGKLPGQYCIKRNPDTTPIIYEGLLMQGQSESRAWLHRVAWFHNQTARTNCMDQRYGHCTNRWLQICIDLTDLKKFIKREHHPTTTVEEVANK